MRGTRLSLLIGLDRHLHLVNSGHVVGCGIGLLRGFVDNLIQRSIEIIRSIPTVPLYLRSCRRLPSRLVGRAQILRHNDRRFIAIRMDRVGACRAWAVLGHAAGGLRHCGNHGRSEPAAYHLPSHVAFVLQPHHRREHAQLGIHGDQRDDSELPGSRSPSACDIIRHTCCLPPKTFRRSLLLLGC